MNIFFCHNKVGYDCLSWLVDSYITDIALVVVEEKNEIYDFCLANNLTVSVFQDESLLIDTIRNLPNSIVFGFLIWWPKILSAHLLNILNIDFINLHPSFLPFGKGKHYNFWAIVDKEPFGVSIHKVTQNVDEGDILFQKTISFNWTDTGESLYYKAQAEITTLFRDNYLKIKEKDFVPIPQIKDSGSFHLSKELDAVCFLKLDDYYTVQELLNLLRARTFSGYPGCRFEDNGKLYECRLTIKEVTNE